MLSPFIVIIKKSLSQSDYNKRFPLYYNITIQVSDELPVIDTLVIPALHYGT